MKTDILTAKQLVFTHTLVTKRNDGIVEVVCDDDICYELEHFQEMHDATAKLCEYKKHPILFLVGKYTSISKEAREFGSTKEATQFSKAEAYVINSLPHKLIANFFLRVDKPSVPTKFFSSRQEAEKWLQTFL